MGILEIEWMCLHVDVFLLVHVIWIYYICKAIWGFEQVT